MLLCLFQYDRLLAHFDAGDATCITDGLRAAAEETASKLLAEKKMEVGYYDACLMKGDDPKMAVKVIDTEILVA